MQTNGVKPNQDILKKLKRKAELCRYSHAELKKENTRYRNSKEFAILVLSVVLVALINLYYKKVLEDDFILVVLWVLPLITTVLQSLDCTIFHWANKVAKHESAIAIWGAWIREADFLEKRIDCYKIDVLNEKIQNIQEKYNNCMDSTEQIPNNKFLKYKRQFRAYLLKSAEIDKMSLKDLQE